MEKKKLYIGSLPYSTTVPELVAFIKEKTEVELAEDKVMIITDKYTGQSKGFGFGEFDQIETVEELQALADKLNGQEMGGRTLVVNIARDREERPPRQDGGGYRGGSGGSGGNSFNRGSGGGGFNRSDRDSGHRSY